MPERSEYANGVPCWVDLASPDLEGSKAFYNAILGWDYETGGEEYGGYVTATLRGKPVAGMMAIGDGAGEGAAPPAWSSYVAVDDLEASVKAAEAAGAKVLMGPMDIPPAGRMAFVMDPVNAAIGMWQPGEHVGAAIVNEPGAWCWNELVTADVDTAAAFYGDVFGWQTQQPFEGDEAAYTVFAFGPDRADGFAGALEPPMEGIPPHWAVYFAVADVEAAVGDATERGANVLAPTFDTPAGRIAPIMDPHGVAVSLIQLPGG